MLSYPITDIKVEFIDGSFHEIDSSDIAFRIAASMALKEAMKKGNPQPVSYTHLRAHETVLDLVCRLLLEKKKKIQPTIHI